LCGDGGAELASVGLQKSEMRGVNQSEPVSLIEHGVEVVVISVGDTISNNETLKIWLDIALLGNCAVSIPLQNLLGKHRDKDASVVFTSKVKFIVHNLWEFS